LIGAAVKVIWIATGGEEKEREATAGAAAEQRVEIARKSAAKRWGPS
jgi:hypothetical protein